MQEGLWQAVLGEIELSISRGNFVTWFKNTQLIKNKDGQFVVGVPNIFVKNQLERKFNDLVIEVLKKNGVEPDKVEYKIHTGIMPTVRNDDEDLLVNASTRNSSPPAKKTIANVTHSYRQGLNEKYNFDIIIKLWIIKYILL